MYLRFCQDTFTKERVDHVHFAGDIVDHHALSFYDHDPNGMSAGHEADAAAATVADWHRVFAGTVSIGNHDERNYRVARKAGLPDRYLKSHAEVWKTPRWQWDYEHTFDGVLYTHGTGHSGKYAAFNLAIQQRMPVVIGHLHGNFGVLFHTNPRSRIFGAATGCGIDVPAYTFAYGRTSAVRPVLGCVVVIDGTEVRAIPMPCGRGEKYHRSRAGGAKRVRRFFTRKT